VNQAHKFIVFSYETVTASDEHTQYIITRDKALFSNSDSICFEPLYGSINVFNQNALRQPHCSAPLYSIKIAFWLNGIKQY
jgi:galactose mutarotase-like enzyme